MRRSVSGRYRGRTDGWELELRLDVDVRDPMKRVSGDFYSLQGDMVSYFGSFIVNSVKVSVEPTNVIVVKGQAKVTWCKKLHRVRITVPAGESRAPATIQFPSFTGSPENTYLCSFESTYFRTIQLEQDYEQKVRLFKSYNTGRLHSRGPARSLSVISAYAEAGIEIQLSPDVNEIPSSEATGAGDSRWDDSELHASMMRHFHLRRNEPQWKVWLIAANEYIDDPDEPPAWGVMFDYGGEPMRQGCAIFHKAFTGMRRDEKKRAQLYTYVHELGHCFNLLHTFERESTRSSPNTSKALSYMNYPGNYPKGKNERVRANAFWADFPFQFDRKEIDHLHHAFRNDIIMGGREFGAGSGSTALRDASAFSRHIEKVSGLKLELRKPDQKKSFAFGEPVVVELKLTTTYKSGKRTHGLLHPKKGFVHIAIRKPNGHSQSYKPLMPHCINPSNTILIDEKYPSVYDSAYIGYGKDGYYFDEPGLYRVRAIYYGLDGSKVTSNIHPILIQNPSSSEDKNVADLLIGKEQGTLLYLIGSDSEFLSKGNEAFDTILQEHRSHFLADYPRFVKGFNQARTFKRITPGKEVDIRKPNLERASQLLAPVIKSSAADRGIDNITLSMTMLHLAYAQKLLGKKSDAENTIGQMIDIFKKKKLKPHVIALLESKSKQII
jgi:hypothetical protein